MRSDSGRRRVSKKQVTSTVLREEAKRGFYLSLVTGLTWVRSVVSNGGLWCLLRVVELRLERFCHFGCDGMHHAGPVKGTHVDASAWLLQSSVDQWCRWSHGEGSNNRNDSGRWQHRYVWAYSAVLLVQSRNLTGLQGRRKDINVTDGAGR